MYGPHAGECCRTAMFTQLPPLPRGLPFQISPVFDRTSMAGGRSQIGFDRRLIEVMMRATSKGIFDAGFWDHPENWPLDSPGYVFLARAFNQFGSAKYGASWDELLEGPEEPDDVDDPIEDDRLWDEYEQAEQKFQTELSAFEARKEAMRVSVAENIAEQCERGSLVAAIRPRPGGEFVRLQFRVGSRWKWDCTRLAREPRGISIHRNIAVLLRSILKSPF